MNSIEINNDTTDFNVLLLIGLRGCLGSGTYAPGCATEFFKKNWADWYGLMKFIKAESPDICAWAAGSNLCNQAEMVGVDEFFEGGK